MVKKIIITGGPGTGKTSLIEELRKNDFKCFDEISREITLKYREKGIKQLFLSDPNLFSQELLNGRIEQFNNSTKLQADYAFFDRGIPDIIAYLDYINSDYPNHFTEASMNYKYDLVFFLESLSIYQGDPFLILLT